MLEAAKAKMEQYDNESGAAMILGGFLSPSHDLYVGEKLKGEDLVLNSRERLDLCRLQTADSDWIDVDPWESTQDRFYDYHKVTSRLQHFLQENCQYLLDHKMRSLLQEQQRAINNNNSKSCVPFQNMVPQRSGSLSSRNPFNIRVVYICGADFVLRTGARKLYGGIVVVDRPLGAPSSNRRSILLTNTGESINVPVSNQIEDSEEIAYLSSSASSTSSMSSAMSCSSSGSSITMSAKQRVFRRLEQAYGFDWCEASRNNIWWLPARSRTESEDISSTRIRNLLSDRKSCHGLLHPAVAQRLLEKKAQQDAA
ncbi:Nicotinamide/nicotinic acid mononucleotide adenylyltransferase 2 [Entomortierella lignicola]|nr:Nicotinamide/nicotinic acid mononucleotide adenylyltransferase 2 [Entomortierella lignicola]